MQKDIPESIIADFLSVPALTFRGVRRKLLKTALDECGVDISPLHIEIMVLLKETGTLHVAEIGERLLIARAQMTHLIDKLVDLGIVKRHMDKSDRRMTKIVLTAKGEAVLEEHDRNIKSAIRETLACLTDKELKDLSVSLKKQRDIFSKLQ